MYINKNKILFEDTNIKDQNHPTVKKLVFDNLSYDGEIVRVFPNLESLEIWEIVTSKRTADERINLHFYAKRLDMLKHLKVNTILIVQEIQNSEVTLEILNEIWNRISSRVLRVIK